MPEFSLPMFILLLILFATYGCLGAMLKDWPCTLRRVLFVYGTSAALAAIVTLAFGCTHVSAGGIRATTFGTAQTKVTAGETVIESSGDGTNLAAVVGGVIKAAKEFFTGGGGDVIVNVPAPAEAPAETPPAP